MSVANGITFTRPRIKRRELTIDRIDTGRGATCATLSRVYMRKRGIYPPLLPFIRTRVRAYIYIFVGRCSRMQEKEEVRTLLLPFLGQSLNCAECFAVVKVYARYRGLLWPCFDHWLSMAWQFR